jgi:hypothetical protein
VTCAVNEGPAPFGRRVNLDATYLANTAALTQNAAPTLLPMTDKASDDQRRLGEDSERLLDSLEELRSLEREKRREPISSPRFHELAKEVTDVSTEIFRDASQEEEDGNQADRSDRTIDDTA